jgi:hypothetical protein
VRPKIFLPVIGGFVVATTTLRHLKVAYSHPKLRTFLMPQVPSGHHKMGNDWGNPRIDLEFFEFALLLTLKFLGV